MSFEDKAQKYKHAQDWKYHGMNIHVCFVTYMLSSFPFGQDFVKQIFQGMKQYLVY